MTLKPTQQLLLMEMKFFNK